MMKSNASFKQKSKSSIKKIQTSLAEKGVKYCLGAYVDIHGIPKGKVVPLAHLLVSDRNTTLNALVSEPVISVPFHADRKTVINMFHKYNLLALPVVDDKGRLLGVVTADDVLELVLKEK